MGVFDAILCHLDDQRDLFGHEVLVFHRVQRKIDARHRPDFACPQPACIDHVFCVDRALVGDHIPCAIRALIGFVHHCVRMDRGPTHARGPSIGVGRAGGIKVTIQRVIQPANNAVDIRDGCDFLNLFRRDDFGFQPHEPMLGAFGDQHVEPVLILGQRDAADMMQAAGHACDFFEFFVQADGIALQSGHIRVAIQRVKATGGVPRRP